MWLAVNTCVTRKCFQFTWYGRDCISLRSFTSLITFEADSGFCSSSLMIREYLTPDLSPGGGSCFVLGQLFLDVHIPHVAQKPKKKLQTTQTTKRKITVSAIAYIKMLSLIYIKLSSRTKITTYDQQLCKSYAICHSECSYGGFFFILVQHGTSFYTFGGLSDLAFIFSHVQNLKRESKLWFAICR